MAWISEQLEKEALAPGEDSWLPTRRLDLKPYSLRVTDGITPLLWSTSYECRIAQNSYESKMNRYI